MSKYRVTVIYYIDVYAETGNEAVQDVLDKTYSEEQIHKTIINNVEELEDE